MSEKVSVQIKKFFRNIKKKSIKIEKYPVKKDSYLKKFLSRQKISENF